MFAGGGGGARSSRASSRQNTTALAVFRDVGPVQCARLRTDQSRGACIFPTQAGPFALEHRAGVRALEHRAGVRTPVAAEARRCETKDSRDAAPLHSLAPTRACAPQVHRDPQGLTGGLQPATVHAASPLRGTAALGRLSRAVPAGGGGSRGVGLGLLASRSRCGPARPQYRPAGPGHGLCTSQGQVWGSRLWCPHVDRHRGCDGTLGHDLARDLLLGEVATVGDVAHHTKSPRKRSLRCVSVLFVLVCS